MSFDDDWLSNGIPQFDGGKNRSLARGMIDALGGPSGFKTAYRTDADGSVTTVQLKGSMPPQVSLVRPRVTPVAPLDPYTETSIDLREYYDDNPNYHYNNLVADPLRPYLFKYIKTVVFNGGIHLNFVEPLLPVGRAYPYLSTTQTAPKNNGALFFLSFYIKIIYTSPPTEAFPVDQGSFYEAFIETAGKFSGDRTFFPEVYVRSCDGIFLTKYKPIKTLKLTNGIIFRFLNPTDRSFHW